MEGAKEETVFGIDKIRSMFISPVAKELTLEGVEPDEYDPIRDKEQGDAGAPTRHGQKMGVKKDSER